MAGVACSFVGDVVVEKFDRYKGHIVKRSKKEATTIIARRIARVPSHKSKGTDDDRSIEIVVANSFYVTSAKHVACLPDNSGVVVVKIPGM
jgi:hypothetical protein